ncbi:MAG: hypothetical protein WCK48_01645 [bacterium]
MDGEIMAQDNVETRQMFVVGDNVRWKRQDLDKILSHILFSMIERGFCGPFVVTETSMNNDASLKEHPQTIWVRQRGGVGTLDLSGFWLEKIK